MELTFKTKNPKQIEGMKAWLNDDVEQILYGGAKGGGKSYLGASAIFGDAHTYPGTHYFIARKELIDLRKHTKPIVQEVHKNWGIKDLDAYMRYNGQDNVYELHNGSKVYLIQCKDLPRDPMYERFGSMQMTRGWIEEGGEIPEEAKKNLWLSIGRWKNDDFDLKKKLLITANPKKGWMKREFIDLYEEGELPEDKVFVPAYATDNVYLSEDYINTLKNQDNQIMRQRLWEGRWDYDEDHDALTTHDYISDAFSNTITKDDKKYLVADIARLGEDRVAISLWRGLEMYKIEVYENQTTDRTTQIIKDIAASESVPYSHILIDADGLGVGVLDNIKGAYGFNGGGSPIKTAKQIELKEKKHINHSLVPKATYGNLKAQCGWKLAQMLNEHKLAFRTEVYRDQILEEVSAILRDRSVDSDGKRYLIKKQYVKQQLGRSPDIGDTLLMRMFFELRANITPSEDPEHKRVAQEQEIKFQRNKSALAQDSAE